MVAKLAWTQSKDTHKSKHQSSVLTIFLIDTTPSMELDPSLTRKLLFSNDINKTNNNNNGRSITSASNQRIAQDALQAAGELIRQFIIETRHRASIEAEFENEIRNSSSKNGKDDDDSDKDYDSDDPLSSPSRENLGKRKRQGRSGNDQFDASEEDEASFIQPKHILKVSAEVLMDFS